MNLKERFDPIQAVLIIAALATMIYLIQWGPEAHKSLIISGLIGFLTTLVAALRGRMVKRDPEKMAKKAAGTSVPPSSASPDSIPVVSTDQD